MRTGKLNRSTNETKVEINLDGTGTADVDSGDRFKNVGTICTHRNRLDNRRLSSCLNAITEGA